MQHVTYFVATSIDGSIARPDDSFDFFVNEGDHVTDYLAALKTFDAVVMGRRTYEMATKVGVNNPYPWLQTFVVSKEIGTSPDPNVTIVTDGAVDAVRALKERPGRGIYLCGGGQLAALLLEHDLVDEITIKLNPVIAGGGIPVVTKMERPTQLQLVDCKVYESGVVFLRYQVKR
jgi:dihydrofolate reductase